MSGQSTGASAPRAGAGSSADEIVVRVDSVIADLVPGYLAARRAELESLNAWVASADFEQIQLLGHRLKGSGAGYGFADITRLGGLLEDAASAGRLDEVREGAEALAAYLQAVRIELP